MGFSTPLSRSYRNYPMGPPEALRFAQGDQGADCQGHTEGAGGHDPHGQGRSEMAGLVSQTM